MYGVYATLWSCILIMIPNMPAGNADENKLLIVGSSTIAPLIEDLGRRFQTTHPGVMFIIEKAGSGHGARDALSGRADIGMVARPLKPNEDSLFVIPIARDGAALVVNKKNPVDGLTHDQACGIFSGRIDNWKSAGGSSRSIKLLPRGKSQGVTSLLIHYLNLPDKEMIFSEEAVLNTDVINGVAAGPDSISFLSIGILEQLAESGRPIKALALDGIFPGTDSIRDGSWPLTRSLTLVTQKVPEGVVKAFIQYVLSPDTRIAIEENGFIPY